MKYMFHHKDPRRLIPLVNHVMEQFYDMDFNGESSLDSVKVLTLFRSFYSGMGWKFMPWADDVLKRFWPEVHSEHDDVWEIIMTTEGVDSHWFVGTVIRC